MKTSLLVAILFLSIAVREVIGVPVAGNCAVKYQASLNETLRLKNTCAGAGFKDCCQVTEASNLFNNYSPESGCYDISNVCGDMTQPFVLDALPAMQARCDVKNDGGGWLVLLRRTPDVNERINFDRAWAEYETGFGDLDSEFWYGLKNIHCLTNQQSVDVRIDLKKRNGTGVAYKYGQFVVDGSDKQYTLHIGDFQGTGHDFMAIHNGMKFTTKDRDNDRHSTNCAVEYPGGWWFRNCYNTHLTESHTVGPRLFNSGFIPYDYAELSVRPKGCRLQDTDTCK